MTDDDLAASKISGNADAHLADIQIELSKDTENSFFSASEQILKRESSANSTAEQILCALRADARLSISDKSRKESNYDYEGNVVGGSGHMAHLGPVIRGFIILF
jgi:hypothetical protein